MPVGKLSRLDVTGIRTLSETKALVDIAIEYEPNKLGERLRKVGLKNPVPLGSPYVDFWGDTFEHVATLERYDDGWRMTDME